MWTDQISDRRFVSKSSSLRMSALAAWRFWLTVEEDPDPEPDRVEVELEGAGEGGDLVGGAVLGPQQSVEQLQLIAGLIMLDLVEVAVLDAVGLVDDPTGRAADR
jgi:hypothetical protein